MAMRSICVKKNPTVQVHLPTLNRIKYRRISSRSHDAILVIGGYGTFGSLLCERLAYLSNDPTNSPFWILIGGRNGKQGKQMVENLKLKYDNVLTDYTTLDITDSSFLQKLKELKPKIVINTTGPFTYMKDVPSKSYHVAQTCLEAGCHYIDLADDRDFVENFSKHINNLAKEKGLTAISGASSVPGLSSVLLDHFTNSSHPHHIDNLKKVEYFISVGGNTPARGVGTMKSVLSYCGKPFQILKDGKYQTTYGFQHVHKKIVHGLASKRLVSECNIPDYSFFPSRYPSLQTLVFNAGVTPNFIQRSLTWLSWLARAGIIRDPPKYASFLKSISDPIFNLSSSESAFQVVMEGTCKDGEKEKHKKIIWTLLGDQGHGPNVAVTAPVILCQKLLKYEMISGASPCIGMFTLDEFLQNISDLDIVTYTHIHQDGRNSSLQKYATGEEFYEKLPSLVQEFHDGRDGAMEGALQVSHGRSFLANFIVNSFPLPRETRKGQDGTPVTVVTDNDSWTRIWTDPDNPSKPILMYSKWTQDRSKHGLTIENFYGGLVKFGFQFKPKYLGDTPAVEMVTKKMWVAGIPVPKFLMGRAHGITVPHKDGEGWFLNVSMKLPFFGLVIQYQGNIRRATIKKTDT